MPTPTIVLVHGAFADAASWAPVTAALIAQGHTVLVPPVFNRSLSGDSAYIKSFVEQIDGPVLQRASGSCRADSPIPTLPQTSSMRRIPSTEQNRELTCP